MDRLMGHQSSVLDSPLIHYWKSSARLQLLRLAAQLRPDAARTGHHAATRGSNTLDLLLTSASDIGLLSRVAVLPTCFSDHDLVTCRLHVPCGPTTIAKYSTVTYAASTSQPSRTTSYSRRCTTNSTEQRQSTTTSSCSTMRCSRSSTNTHHSSPGPGASVVTISVVVQ